MEYYVGPNSLDRIFNFLVFGYIQSDRLDPFCGDWRTEIAPANVKLFAREVGYIEPKEAAYSRDEKFQISCVTRICSIA